MYKFLEKVVHTIVPHEKNKNIPHILQETSVAFLLFIVVGLFIFTNKNLDILRNLNMTATVYPAVLADLTNQARASSGLSGLKWNDTLAEAAQMKASDMIANGYFAHTSPAGITPWHWLEQIKYNFWYAGENLAIRFNDSRAVEDAWLNSPTHKANIMSKDFSEIGIAAVDGTYQGSNTTFVVEYFATPAILPPIYVPPPITPSPTPAKAPAKAKTPTKAVVANPTPKPVVAGAETQNPVVALVTPPKTEQNLKTITEDKSFVVVQNTTPDITPATTSAVNKPQSLWYQRLLVNPSNPVRSIYLLIIGAIMTSMALMLFKEYERHHLKHLAMGFGMVVVLVCMIYLIPSTVLFV